MKAVVNNRFFSEFEKTYQKKTLANFEKMVKIYQSKVYQYPKGSLGYDPVDLMNLEYYQAKVNEIKNQTK
jgi:hypothetical protein